MDHGVEWKDPNKILEGFNLNQASKSGKAKASQSRIPAPQRARIVQRFVSGQGIRQISREEKRSRVTVTRIVRASEVQAYVQDLRAAYYGLGQEAVDALRRSIRRTTDGKIAYQLLADIGVVPDQEERQRSRTVGTQEDEDREARGWVVKLAYLALQRRLAYGMPLDDFEEDVKKLGLRIDYAAGAIVEMERRRPELNTGTTLGENQRNQRAGDIDD